MYAMYSLFSSTHREKTVRDGDQYLNRTAQIKKQKNPKLRHKKCSTNTASRTDGKPPQISDPRVRFWDSDFGPPEGGHLFGRYLQCKIKENGLKIEEVTY